jgi:hypothetical protein
MFANSEEISQPNLNPEPEFCGFAKQNRRSSNDEAKFHSCVIEDGADLALYNLEC